MGVHLLAVEMYGGWVEKACETFECTCMQEASCGLSFQRSDGERQELFGRLSLILMRENTQVLSLSPPPPHTHTHMYGFDKLVHSKQISTKYIITQ